ncbi:MAG TPA: PLP-dependent aminotransferase family protein [Xanthomonadales bacterium]|nr:PLP-dependent aminotransferase family protein [Xanthomonadales bacterium]
MKTTKYQKLVNELKSAIDDGRYLPGAKLPSVREMMGMHQLSLSTVTTAFAILEEHGLIEPRARSGYFVRPSQKASGHWRSMGDEELRGGFHWWPDAELFPRERLRKLTATVVRRHPDLAIQSPVNCNPRLTRELAKRCAETGCYVYEQDIMITHGVTEALSVALHSTTTAADKVLLQSPVAPLYKALCDSLGLETVLLDARLPEAEQLRAFEILAAMEDGPRVALLASNFHCPTGTSLSLATKQEILRIARARDVVIIEDDSSGDLHFDSSRPLPIKAFDREGEVIYVMAATKTIAPGLQLGWIVSGEPWRDRIEQTKSISAAAVDHLPQLVMAEFLAHGSHLPHLRKLREALKVRASLFEGILQSKLAPVEGLCSEPGGYTRFLSAPALDIDEDLEQTCRQRWPDLFTFQKPYFRFKSGGISVNMSFELNKNQCRSLQEFGDFLSEYVKQRMA